MKQTLNYKNSFRILKGGKVSLVVSTLLASSTICFASPIGGVVTSGSATINQSGNTTNINQSSAKASINWSKFNIAKNETVNFNQPNINSITLNRVVGNETSVINGALNATGQVWILNSNGVLFGKNASINTSGLLATTKNISDLDFQNGNYTFSGDSTNSVINEGTIEVNNSSYVILASNETRNSGTIKAIKGSVHLVGASEYSINLNGNSLVNLKVEKGVLDSLVENSGTIIANGGEIYLTTNAVDELIKGVVNNSGVLEANSIDDVKGHIELFAHGGTTNIDGTISATDGFIETSGRELNVDSSTLITANKWLLDPVNMTIESTGGSGLTGASVSASAIESALSGTTNVELEADEDITVDENITWSTSNQLTLTAGDEIYVNAIIENTNATNGGVYFNAANTTDKVIFGANGKVIINNIYQLQWISTALAGTYELGSNIDASATSTWNSGDGFDPIGDASNKFTGSFDGLGHTIDSLTINRKNEDDIGLFGYIVGDKASTQISDVGLTDVDITGKSNTGGLIGQSRYSIISNSYVEGDVTGTSTVGGLIGLLYYSQLNTSYADVNVIGTSTVGGLVGSGANAQITNTYALGTVTGTGNNVAGLLGVSNVSLITNSYASNTISATTPYGLVASEDFYSRANNSFYDSTVNPGMADETLYGKTTAQLQIASTFSDAGWDIESFEEGFYPTLAWQHPNINTTKTWVTGEVIEPTPNPTPTPTQNSKNSIDNIIAPINNHTVTNFANKEIFKAASFNNIKNFGNRQANISALETNSNKKIVTLSQLKQSSGKEDIKVALSDDSIVTLHNSAINLPFGVDQEFFISEKY